MQVVLNCYRPVKREPKSSLPTPQVVHALSYFNLPVESWPLGAQLHKRVMDQDTKAATAASQIVGAVKAKLVNAVDGEIFTMAETEKTKATLLKSRWYFTLTQEQGLYSVVMGRTAQSTPNGISPILHVALKAAAAAEQMEFHVREKAWEQAGYFEVAIMA